MERSFGTVAAKKTEAVVKQRLDDIRTNPQEHAHDQAKFTQCCSIDGEIRKALSDAHWQHVT